MDSRQNHSARPFSEKFLQYIKKQCHWGREKSKWNWPELHLYCGVCELKTGLYIRSFLSMFIYVVSLIINVLILCYLVRSGIKFCFMDISDIEEYYGVSFSQVKVKIYRVKMIYTVLISYMMFWVLFRIAHIVGVFLTIYAVYKKKPKIVKFVLYASVVNWILCIFISIFGIMLLDMFSRVLVIICILYEGYNLMALNSEYKKLSGKSKLLVNLSYTDGDTEAAPNPPDSSEHVETDQPFSDNRKHCDTCNCYDGSINQSSAVTTVEENVPSETSSDTNQALDLEPKTEKALNIKDVEMIFNQDLLVPGQSTVLEVAQCANEILVESRGHRVTRPRTLQLSPYPEKKIDIVDIPIIYDENQLQVGGSPVIEEQRNPRHSS